MGRKLTQKERRLLRERVREERVAREAERLGIASPTPKLADRLAKEHGPSPKPLPVNTGGRLQWQRAKLRS